MSVLYIKSLGTELKECQKENMLLRKIIKEQEKIIELMADSLSDVAFYMDEASEYCEVKKKECDCYQNKLGCKECLIDYFEKKARE